MADDVPLRDEEGKEIGRARVVPAAGGGYEIEGEITDPEIAQRLFGKPVGYSRTETPVEPPSWWTASPRDLAEDARGPVADAVDRASAKKPGNVFASLIDTATAGLVQDKLHASMQAALQEQEQLAWRVEIELQQFSDEHRDAIVEQMQQRAALFERIYYEAPRGFTRIQTPQAMAMQSVLDDVNSGRL